MSGNPQNGVTEVCNLLVLKFLEQSGHEKIAKKFRNVTNTTTGKNSFKIVNKITVSLQSFYKGLSINEVTDHFDPLLHCHTSQGRL